MKMMKKMDLSFQWANLEIKIKNKLMLIKCMKTVMEKSRMIVVIGVIKVNVSTIGPKINELSFLRKLSNYQFPILHTRV